VWPALPQSWVSPSDITASQLVCLRHVSRPVHPKCLPHAEGQVLDKLCQRTEGERTYAYPTPNDLPRPIRTHNLGTLTPSWHHDVWSHLWKSSNYFKIKRPGPAGPWRDKCPHLASIHHPNPARRLPWPKARVRQARVPDVRSSSSSRHRPPHSRSSWRSRQDLHSRLPLSACSHRDIRDLQSQNCSSVISLLCNSKKKWRWTDHVSSTWRSVSSRFQNISTEHTKFHQHQNFIMKKILNISLNESRPVHAWNQTSKTIQRNNQRNNVLYIEGWLRALDIIVADLYCY